MNKKILLFCICLSAGVSAAAFADRIVDPLRLPKSIQNYVQQCFPNDRCYAGRIRLGSL